MSAPTLPPHLEGCAEVCAFSTDPGRPWQTACGKSVVPFGPVTPHASLVSCPDCLAAQEPRSDR